MYINLDIARGLAALGVFLFHIHAIIEPSSSFIAHLAKYGNFGVPLFFVISGYVIISSAESAIRNSKKSSAFLKSRFLRIYPPFWASIIIVIVMPYIMEAVSYLKSGQYVWPTPLYLSLSTVDWLQIASLTKIFMSDSGDLPSQFEKINIVYWTLAIEFQFYLCVYTALLFRRHFHSIVALITVISVLIIIFPLPLNAGLFIYFWPMFAIGILLYYLMVNGISLDKFFPKENKLISIVIVLGLILLLVILASLDLLKDLLSDFFPSREIGFAIVSAAILWVAAPLDRTLVRIKNEGNIISRNIIKAAAFMGVISYSVYLLHGKISGLPAMFVRQIAPDDSLLYPLIIVIGTILLCALFYRYVERPFMSNKQKEIYQNIVTSRPNGR